MIWLINNVQVFADVHIDSMAQPECAVAGSVADRAEDSGDGGAVESVSWPFLHSVVELIEDIDRCVGDEHVGWLVELIGCRSKGTDRAGGRG